MLSSNQKISDFPFLNVNFYSEWVAMLLFKITFWTYCNLLKLLKCVCPSSPFFYKHEQYPFTLAVMNMCAMDIYFASFNVFFEWIFGKVPTAWYYLFSRSTPFSLNKKAMTYNRLSIAER